jgi:spermidine synthase
LKEAYLEKLNNVYYKLVIPDRELHSEKSEYQQIDIIEINGEKSLMLDNFMQLYTGDEFIYHEMLAHFPLSHSENPKSVLVLGGGDGFLLRELLKYKSVEKITLVDIDRRVVELSKEYFKDENNDSFNDQRVNVVIDDAVKFAKLSDEKFDVVIMDLIAYENGADLYNQELVKGFAKLVKPGGIFATHGDDIAMPNYLGLKMFATIKPIFKHSKVTSARVPSFCASWTFMVFSEAPLEKRNPERAETRYFDYDTEYGIPAHLRAKLMEFEKGIGKYSENEIFCKKIGLQDLEKSL